MKKLLLMLVFAGAPFAYQRATAGVDYRDGRRSRPAPTKLPSAEPAPTFVARTAMDEIIERAIADREIPGAVLVIGHKGRVVFQKAYGYRALVPRREPMTLNTIFDIASLTKVVGTTSAIAKLVEEGEVRLNEKVTHYIPEFQAGKSDITVRNLLTHFSGMRPDIDLEPVWSGHDTGIRMAVNDRPIGPPNAHFLYSDINFELLGEIVSRVSGKTLPQYVTEKIFRPLGMTETMYLPPRSLVSRIAPTEIVKGSTCRCEAWSTILRHVIWAESRDTLACSPPRRIYRNSPR